MLITLEGCDFHFTFSYLLKSTPELIYDNGTAKAWLKDLNFTIKASPSVNKDFVQFDIDEI